MKKNRTIDAQRLLVAVLWEAGIDSEEFTSVTKLKDWVAKEAGVSARFVRRNVENLCSRVVT